MSMRAVSIVHAVASTPSVPVADKILLEHIGSFNRIYKWNHLLFFERVKRKHVILTERVEELRLTASIDYSFAKATITRLTT